MTSFEPEAVPVAHTRPDPGLVERTPIDRASPLAEAEDREQRRWNRTRAVGMICLIINIIGGVFAVVLAAHPPESHADVIIDNCSWQRPTVSKWPTDTLKAGSDAN